MSSGREKEFDQYTNASVSGLQRGSRIPTCGTRWPNSNRLHHPPSHLSLPCNSNRSSRRTRKAASRWTPGARPTVRREARSGNAVLCAAAYVRGRLVRMVRP